MGVGDKAGWRGHCRYWAQAACSETPMKKHKAFEELQVIRIPGEQEKGKNGGNKQQ